MFVFSPAQFWAASEVKKQVSVLTKHPAPWCVFIWRGCFNPKLIVFLCACQCLNPSHFSWAQKWKESHEKSIMLHQIKSLATQVKNQRKKCQCLGREKKKILKYTFIQSQSKIKQQNWSALPQPLLSASMPHLTTKSTFYWGHLHNNSRLCCHLSYGHNPACFSFFKRSRQRCLWSVIHSNIITNV